MGENTLKAVAFLAIIIGAAGVGSGVFTAWQVQTGVIKGQDGDDGDDGITTTIITYDNVIEYPCASEADINNALTAIGTGYGIITITANITLSGTINIDDGGNYIIQSAGASLKSAINQRAFHITNTKSLTIQNLKIDATAITTDLILIWIEEVSDNPIYIKNVHIIGDDNTKGTGIRIDSESVWISECYFYKVKYGVYSFYGRNAHIYNNEINNWGVDAFYLFGGLNFIEGNVIRNGPIGIRSDFESYNNIISNNIIYNFSIDGIRLYSNYTSVVGNYIGNNTVAVNPLGIYVEGSYNTIDANSCYNIKGTGTGIGIYISSYAYNNTVVGNTCLFNDVPIDDQGINTYNLGNQFF